MNLRTIPRTAIGGTLKLSRLPFDAAIALLPGGGQGGKPAKVRLDLADARVRSTVAALIGDHEMREDARHREEAALQRRRAIELRDQGDQKVQRAEASTERRRDQAQERRERADARAKTERKRADQQAAQVKKDAAERERKRDEAVEQAAAKREEQVKNEADRERLAAVSAKSEALEERDQAFTASDEAQRLADAAARAKSERKEG
jgi:hypothetical protein